MRVYVNWVLLFLTISGFAITGLKGYEIYKDHQFTKQLTAGLVPLLIKACSHETKMDEVMDYYFMPEYSRFHCTSEKGEEVQITVMAKNTLMIEMPTMKNFALINLDKKLLDVMISESMKNESGVNALAKHRHREQVKQELESFKNQRAIRTVQKLLGTYKPTTVIEY